MKLTPFHVNRRQCLEGLLALATPTALSAGQAREARAEYTLENASLAFRFALHQGRAVSRDLKNKLVDEIVDLPEADFALEFAGGAVTGPSEFTAHVVRKNAETIEIVYSGAVQAVADIEVRVEYSLPLSKDYLRKQLSVRQARKGVTRRLMRADLDVWKGVRRDWKSATADVMRYGSHPIYCETMWAGVEFVAAFNTYSSQGFVLRSRPGGTTLTSGWSKLHSTVVGAAGPCQVKDAFLRYIDDVRMAPPRLVAGYNTWWTLPEIFNEKECLALVQALVKDLHEPHGVFFDLVTADMGWSAPQSIWEVNKTDFPNGLSAIVETLKPAKGKLGLWMSPSEVYAPVIDYGWAEKNGYVLVPATHDPRDSHGEGLSLADPKYLDAVKTQLRRLIEQDQLGHIKFDGFIAQEQRAHHQLLP